MVSEIARALATRRWEEGRAPHPVDRLGVLRYRTTLSRTRSRGTSSLAGPWERIALLGRLSKGLRVRDLVSKPLREPVPPPRPLPRPSLPPGDDVDRGYRLAYGRYTTLRPGDVSPGLSVPRVSVTWGHLGRNPQPLEGFIEDGGLPRFQPLSGSGDLGSGADTDKTSQGALVEGACERGVRVPELDHLTQVHHGRPALICSATAMSCDMNTYARL